MTNKDYIIELQHMPTGLATAWRIARYPSPSVTYVIEERERIHRDQSNFKTDGGFNVEALSETDQKKFVDLSKQYDDLSFKLMAMVLEPTFDLPERMDKIGYLRECIGVYEVFDMVIGFFLSICSSSMKSPKGTGSLQAAELSRMVTIRQAKA